MRQGECLPLHPEEGGTAGGKRGCCSETPMPHPPHFLQISHLGDEKLRGDLHSDAHEEESHEQSLVGGNV